MVYLPRGIDPELLLSQVKNTMPYLFSEGVAETPLGKFVPATLLREYDKKALREYEQKVSGADVEKLSHFEYFRLCVSSHFLTCATPVPTDVDNQIRFKLWPKELPIETALEMAQFVLESRRWDFTVVSQRHTQGAQGSPWENEVLGGHLGEWFTIACAAYCALKPIADSRAVEKRRELFENIRDEVNRHSEIFGSLWRGHAGVECLKTSANIAHNLGDLDRVMDMWDLGYEDPLRLEFYKLTASPFDSNRKLRYLGRLWVAGELYKSTIEGTSMALENHRHFALRKPKGLRQSPTLLIPNGPFFDNWGRTVARFENAAEVVEALKHGWERLPRTAGYGRALRGIFEVLPELRFDGSNKVRQFSSVLNLDQAQFEKKWNDEALRLMDDIPSRA